MNQIHIDEVLLLIQEQATLGKTFAIQFVRATGKEKGSLKLVAKARYGSSSREASSEALKMAQVSDEARKISLHVDNGTIPLTDVQRNQYFTPLIRTIVGFNGKTVVH